MKLNSLHLIILALVGVVIFLSIRSCKQSKVINDADQIANLDKALNDTITKTVDKNGDTTYSKQAFIAEIGLLTDVIAKKDTELARLAKEKNKVAVKVVTVTKLVDSGKTIIDTVKDTRTATIVNPHFTADFVSTPVKTTVNVSFRDTATYAIDKNGRLNTKHSNPYLSVVDQNAFIVLPKQRKKNWKYWVGAVVGGVLVYGVTR